MVLRIHPAPLHYDDRWASWTNSSGYSSQRHMEFGFQSPSDSPVGSSDFQTGRRQVHRWLESREDAPLLPFLALSTVREFFCFVSKLTHLDSCVFLSFVWAEMFGNSSCTESWGAQPLLFTKA